MNKSIIVSSVILAGGYITGKIIGASSANKRTEKIAEGYKEAVDKVMNWCETYTEKLTNMYN